MLRWPVRSSLGPWLETARNVVEFGADDVMYAEWREYLKTRRRR